MHVQINISMTTYLKGTQGTVSASDVIPWHTNISARTHRPIHISTHSRTTQHTRAVPLCPTLLHPPSPCRLLPSAQEIGQSSWAPCCMAWYVYACGCVWKAIFPLLCIIVCVGVSFLALLCIIVCMSIFTLLCIIVCGGICLFGGCKCGPGCLDTLIVEWTVFKRQMHDWMCPCTQQKIACSNVIVKQFFCKHVKSETDHRNIIVKQFFANI